MEEFVKSGLYGSSEVKTPHKNESFGGGSFGFLSTEKKTDMEKTNVLKTDWNVNIFGQEFGSVLPNIPEADGSPVKKVSGLSGGSGNMFGSNNVAAMLPAGFGGFGSKSSGPKVDTAALFGLKKDPNEKAANQPETMGLFGTKPTKGLFGSESTETKGESGLFGSLDLTHGSGLAGFLDKSEDLKVGTGAFGTKKPVFSMPKTSEKEEVTGFSNKSFGSSETTNSKGLFGSLSGLGESNGFFGSSGSGQTHIGIKSPVAKSTPVSANAPKTDGKSDPAVNYEGVKKYQEKATKKLFDWYTANAPEKIPKMKTLLNEKYKGREGIFYLWICQKKRIPYELPPYCCRTRATLAPENDYCFGDGGCFPEFPQQQTHPLFKKKSGVKKDQVKAKKVATPPKKATQADIKTTQKPPLLKKKKPAEPKLGAFGSSGKSDTRGYLDFSSFSDNKESSTTESYSNPLESRLPEQVSWLEKQVQGVAQHCKDLTNMMKTQPNCSVNTLEIEASLEKLALNATSGESYRAVTQTHSQLIGNIALTKTFIEGSSEECIAAEREAADWIHNQKTRMESQLNECEDKMKNIRESLKVRKLETSETEKVKSVQELMKQNHRIIKALDSRINVLERQRSQDGLWKRTPLKSPKSIPILTTPLITPKHRGKGQLFLDHRPKSVKVKPDTTLKPVTISFSLPPSYLDAPPNMVPEEEYKKNASSVISTLINLMVKPIKRSTFTTPTPKQSRNRLKHSGSDFKPLSHKVVWPEDRRNMQECQSRLSRLNVSKFRSPKERLPFPPIPKSPKPPKVQPPPPPPLIQKEIKKPSAAPLKPKAVQAKVTPLKASKEKQTESVFGSTVQAKVDKPPVLGKDTTTAGTGATTPAVKVNGTATFGQPATTGAPLTAIEEYTKRITHIYNTNPKADGSKLAGVLNKLKTKYSGVPPHQPPHNLYRQICTKYNITPEPEYKVPTATTGFGIASSGFGTTPTTNAFGMSTASTNVFGTTTTPATTVFGSTAPASTFGTNTNSFGTSTTTNAFGQSTPNAFGTTTSGFGTTATSSAFGQPTTSAFGTSSTTGGFGSLSTSGFGGATTSGGFGSFGTSTPGFGSSGAFGAPATTTSAFGSSAGSGFSSFSGNTGGFGGAAKTGMSSSIFGSTPTGNNFQFDTGAFR